MNYMQIQQQMKIAGGGTPGGMQVSQAGMQKIQKYKQFLDKPHKNEDEMAVYNMQMAKALGAESLEEAHAIIRASGI
jgi:hypothetical protein